MNETYQCSFVFLTEGHLHKCTNEDNPVTVSGTKDIIQVFIKKKDIIQALQRYSSHVKLRFPPSNFLNQRNAALSPTHLLVSSEFEACCLILTHFIGTKVIILGQSLYNLQNNKLVSLEERPWLQRI